MDSYTLQKRVVLSFETKQFDDGDTDYTYVVDVSTNIDETLLAFTLSSGSIRIVQKSDLSSVSTIETQHRNIINTHFVVCAPNVMVICYRNGCIDVYDYVLQTKRIGFQVAQEVHSSSLLCGGKMIVCGDKQHLYFHEVESGKRIGIYTEIHSDVINTLLPHPNYPTVFASGSEDGLICMFDIARGNQEEAIVGIFQTDNGVSSMGWYGVNFEMLWCASMTRGLSLWNTTTGDRVLLVNDFYMVHCEAGLEMDYVVGCITQAVAEPVVLCGNQEGIGYLMDVNHPEQVIRQWDGHQSTIRKLIEIGDMVITCGEDASICVWGRRVFEQTNNNGGAERKSRDRDRDRERTGKQKYKSL